MDKISKAVDRLYQYLVSKPTHFTYEDHPTYEELVKDEIRIRVMKPISNDVLLIHKDKLINIKTAHQEALREGFKLCLKGQKADQLNDAELILQELLAQIDEM